MFYWGEEYRLGPVYANEDDAKAKVAEDLHKLDYYEEREIRGMP